ncbi:MAG: cobalamin B12-binding domain-containing protein [Actinobacteria bacterium]|nr:cobalamin B12-binding domain-containing protein [Actinomycetota bacterium]
MEGKPIRVLLAKAGLDGHNRGIQLVGKALRDAGMEVLYGGLRITPEEVVEMSIQEDVDVVGISIFSGGLMTIIPKIFQAMQQNEATRDIPLIVGGILPPGDAEALKAMGIRAVFGPGSDLEEIASFIRGLAAGSAAKEKAASG